MYKVNTPDGERYLVQLVGPRSYRMQSQMTMRGQTLTVTKRTRDYLVRKTGGAWSDFDPTPQEPVEELFPPQFGEPGGPRIDMDDLDPKKNPALTMQQAVGLANHGGGAEVASNNAPDIEDLNQAPGGQPEKPNESGDITGADVKNASTQGGGGKTAAKGGQKSGNVTIGNPPKADEAKKQGAVTVE